MTRVWPRSVDCFEPWSARASRGEPRNPSIAVPGHGVRLRHTLKKYTSAGGNHRLGGPRRSFTDRGGDVQGIPRSGSGLSEHFAPSSKPSGTATAQGDGGKRPCALAYPATPAT